MSLDSKEDSEEANFCLMADTDSSEADELREVRNDLEILEKAYDELLGESDSLAKAFLSMKQKYSNLSKDYEEKCIAYESLLEKTDKLRNDNSEMRIDILKLKIPSENPQSEEVEKLQQKVADLTLDLAKFVKGTDNLEKLYGYQRKPSDKSGLGFNSENHYKKFNKNLRKSKPRSKLKNSSCYHCGKAGHITSKCRYKPKHKSSQTNATNLKGPRKIWVPKSQIIPVVDLLDRKKEKPVMVPGQWMLTSHDGRKVYVPKPKAPQWWTGNFWRESDREGDRGR